MRSTPPAPGFSAVTLPGDRGRANMAERERSGVELPAATWQRLTAEAARLGVTPPGPLA